MPIDVISFLQPANDNSNFGVAKDTDMMGGWRAVADIAERDAIFDGRRKEGMLTYVISTLTTYRLVGGIDNADWVPTVDGGGLVTVGDITFPIDYQDVGAVDPPAGTVFTNQTAIDDFLADNAATNFKHVRLVTDAIPPLISHSVTLNLAGGIHRPTGLGEYVFDWRATLLDGNIFVQGEPTISTWPVKHAGGTITGHQILDEVTGVREPYIDFAASTFPNDGSLNGKYAIFDNGFMSVIYEHTDSRLWLCRQLSPAPVNGVTTAFVGQPDTTFRNSLDDLVAAHNGTIRFVLNGRPGAPGGPPMTFNDITVEEGWSNSIHSFFTFPGSAYTIRRFHTDVGFGPSPNGFMLRTTDNTVLNTQDVSLIAPLSATIRTGFEVSSEAQGRFSWGYIQGGGDYNIGVFGVLTRIRLKSSVLRDGGGGSFPEASMAVIGAALDIDDLGTGVVNTIIAPRSGFPGLKVEGDGAHFNIPTFDQGLRFRDCPNACMELQSNVTLKVPSGDGFVDGGGNLDVGIDFVGSQIEVELPAATDVTGANGDVRFAGEIETHADIAATGPFVDLGSLNRIEHA